MIKTLLMTTGAVLLTVSGLQAAPGGAFGGGVHAGAAGGPGARTQVRPSANYSRAGGARYAYRGYYRGYGPRFYYLGGVPFFYDPFFFGFGYGYYGGFYGGPGGYGPYGYGNGAYDGQLADGNGQNRKGGDAPDPSALPKEVQKQLASRGYYKGSVDGEFGPATKTALTRFQHDNNLRATGRVDGATLKALGFDDREGAPRQ